MRVIETTAVVQPDGTLEARVPPDVAPGEYRVIVVLEEAGTPRSPGELDLPVYDLGPWLGGSLRRADLYGDEGR